MNLAAFSGTAKGTTLANKAGQVARRLNTVGRCFAGAAEAINGVFGATVWGASAYMAAGQLAANSKFTEKSISASQLGSLPAGAIVVWGKTSASPHGHISIALGNGQEASDHVSNQMTSLRGYTNSRVFMPK